jgi:hypothetical protein
MRSGEVGGDIETWKGETWRREKRKNAVTSYSDQAVRVALVPHLFVLGRQVLESI